MKVFILSQRAKHEIDHGKILSQGDPELIWGWGTPAGRLRAKKRAELISINACLKPGMNILEIGCGTGLFTEMFAHTGAQIIGMDISPDLLEKAKARNLPKDQVKFFEKNFHEYDIDGSFDAVIGSSVLHHLDIIPALTIIYKLQKPGGCISFAEPNMLNPQVFLERKLSFIPFFNYVSPDETAFLRWSLQSTLYKAGFEDVKIVPFDWLHPATPEIFIGFVKLIGYYMEKIPILREFSGSISIFARRPLN